MITDALTPEDMAVDHRITSDVKSREVAATTAYDQNSDASAHELLAVWLANEYFVLKPAIK